MGNTIGASSNITENNPYLSERSESGHAFRGRPASFLLVVVFAIVTLCGSLILQSSLRNRFLVPTTPGEVWSSEDGSIVFLVDDAKQGSVRFSKEGIFSHEVKFRQWGKLWDDPEIIMAFSEQSSDLNGFVAELKWHRTGLRKAEVSIVYVYDHNLVDWKEGDSFICYIDPDGRGNKR